MSLIKCRNGLPRETVAFLSFESFQNSTGQSTEQPFQNSNIDPVLNRQLNCKSPEVLSSFNDSENLSKITLKVIICSE